MSELKHLSKEAIPPALEKAERYRLLNEPGEAESICLDILKTDPENQQAIITLLLALTAMLPFTMKASPPNMAFSVTPGSSCRASRSRFASTSSYAMALILRSRHDY